MQTSRLDAATREAARVLRSGECPAACLRALRCCALSAGEIERVLRGRYRLRTIYGALNTLRLVGLATPSGHKVAMPGRGAGEIWRAI